MFETVKGENAESEFHLSKEEVLAQVISNLERISGFSQTSLQMKVLLVAGYETTSSELLSYIQREV